MIKYEKCSVCGEEFDSGQFVNCNGKSMFVCKEHFQDFAVTQIERLNTQLEAAEHRNKLLEKGYKRNSETVSRLEDFATECIGGEYTELFKRVSELESKLEAAESEIESRKVDKTDWVRLYEITRDELRECEKREKATESERDEWRQKAEAMAAETPKEKAIREGFDRC